MALRTFDTDDIEYKDDHVLIHVISDSMGDTAAGVVAAAASQFELGSVKISRLPQVRSVEQVVEYLDSVSTDDHAEHPSAVFHTIVDTDLRNDIRRELESRQIFSIDIIGPAINVLSTLTETEPLNIPGGV